MSTASTAALVDSSRSGQIWPKLGNIPDGGGWRVTGVAQGLKNKRATTGLRHGKTSHPVIGYSYLHTAIDDHSRLAYTEILADERKETAAHEWPSLPGINLVTCPDNLY